MNKRIGFDFQQILANKSKYEPSIIEINSKNIIEKYQIVLNIYKHTKLLMRVPHQYPLYPIKFYLEFNKSLFLIWYFCKSTHLLDIFNTICKFYPYNPIVINYKYVFLKLGIKSNTNSSIVFEYDDTMQHSPIIHLDEYINRALLIGYKYNILPHPVFYTLK